jgi:6-pyruvoyl-tetrahydropterin synthase
MYGESAQRSSHFATFNTKKLPHTFISMFMTYVHIKFHVISHIVAKFDNNIQNSISTSCVSVTVFLILLKYDLHEITLVTRSVTISTEFHSKSSLHYFNIHTVSQACTTSIYKVHTATTVVSAMDVLKCKPTTASNNTVSMLFMNMPPSLMVIMADSHQDLIT